MEQRLSSHWSKLRETAGREGRLVLDEVRSFNGTHIGGTTELVGGGESDVTSERASAYPCIDFAYLRERSYVPELTTVCLRSGIDDCFLPCSKDEAEYEEGKGELADQVCETRRGGEVL